MGEEYGPSRRPGETNNDQVKRLNAEINQLRSQLKVAQSAHGHGASLTAVDRARIKSLESENMSLKRQIQIMTASPEARPESVPVQNDSPPRGKAGVRHKKTGVQESTGQLAAVE
jgi:hypothetical protein